MQFESWQAFWDMGGYALYVWLSFGVTFVCMVGLVLTTRHTHKQVMKTIVKEKARRTRMQKNAVDSAFRPRS